VTAAFDAFVESGRSKLGFRLVIEGLGYEFVTATALENTTADGRQRVATLAHDGLGWIEKADITAGRLDVQGFTCRLVDRESDQVMTKALAWEPTEKTWLIEDLGVGGNVVTVMSTVGMSNSVIHVGTEAMRVSTVLSATELGVTRAYWDTIAQAHYTEDGANLSYPVVSLWRPMSIEGRRCYLYAYAPGDSYSGDGTLIFRGTCATDARLESNGADWRITVDSITRLMDAPIGADLESDVLTRGIYYTWLAPLRVLIQGGLDPAQNLILDIPSQEHPQGFFETQEEFCDYLTAALATGIAGFDVSSIVAVPSGRDDWWLEVLTGSTGEYAPIVQAWSAIDGTLSEWSTLAGEPTNGRAQNTLYTVRGGAGTNAAVPGPVVRRVPRGSFNVTSGPVLDPGIPSANPEYRIHVGGSVSLSGVTAVRVEWPGADELYHAVINVSESERWIHLGSSFGLLPDGAGYGRGAQARMRFVRTLGRGTVATVRDTVTALSQTLANTGGVPFLTTGDLASWTAVALAAARGKTWASTREFFVDEETTFADYVAEEFKAVGVFPVIDADGKIAIERMRAPALTEPEQVTLDGDVAAVDRGFPTWERNKEGRVNQVAYSWGYKPSLEEHSGTVIVRDVQAFSESKTGNTIEVKPKSAAASEPVIAELVSLAWAYLGVFGRAYSVVSAEASLATAFKVQLGQAVAVSLPHVPNTETGQRGVERVVGLLIERGVDIDGGRSRLSVLIHSGRLKGYPPSMRITRVETLGADQYRLTVDGLHPTNTGVIICADTPADHYAPGDSVVMRDVASTTNLFLGTVDAVTLTTIDVTTTSTPGVFYLIEYSTAGLATDSQTDYAYQAEDDGRVPFPTPEPAGEYSP